MINCSDKDYLHIQHSLVLLIFFFILLYFQSKIYIYILIHIHLTWSLHSVLLVKDPSEAIHCKLRNAYSSGLSLVDSMLSWLQHLKPQKEHRCQTKPGHDARLPDMIAKQWSFYSISLHQRHLQLCQVWLVALCGQQPILLVNLL